MKKISFVLITAFCLSAINAQNPSLNLDSLSEIHTNIPRVNYAPYKKGEKLEYLVHYGFVNAGVATVEIDKSTSYFEGKRIYKVKGHGRSKGAFDWFFKVRDYYESYVDVDKAIPYKFVRDVSEGGYKFSQRYKFDQAEEKVTDHKGKTKEAPYGVQDMLSALYFARTIDLSQYKKGDVIVFFAYVDGKVEPLKIRYQGKAKIEVKSGTYNCLKFQPLVQKGRIFDDPEDLTVYITDDKNRIPVLAKANVLVGSVKMELTNYEGLAHKIAKIEKS